MEYKIYCEFNTQIIEGSSVSLRQKRDLTQNLADVWSFLLLKKLDQKWPLWKDSSHKPTFRRIKYSSLSGKVHLLKKWFCSFHPSIPDSSDCVGLTWHSDVVVDLWCLWETRQFCWSFDLSRFCEHISYIFCNELQQRKTSIHVDCGITNKTNLNTVYKR